MKIKVSNGMINACQFLGEIEIKGLFLTLYQYSKRKYFIYVENDGFYEFNNRKAVNKFISEF